MPVTGANHSQIINNKYFPPIIFASERETPTNAYSIMSDNCVHAFPALSLVKPDSIILTPKDGLRWRKLLVQLALNIKWKLNVIFSENLITC